jgi:hypothetical protein
MKDVDKTVCSGSVPAGFPSGSKKVMAGWIEVKMTVSMGVTIIATDSAPSDAVGKVTLSFAD